MAELKQSKLLRGANRSVVTKTIAKISEELLKNDDDIDVVKLDGLKLELMRLRGKLRECDEEILLLIDDEFELETDVTASSEYYLTINNSLGYAEKRILPTKKHRDGSTDSTIILGDVTTEDIASKHDKNSENDKPNDNDKQNDKGDDNTSKNTDKSTKRDDDKKRDGDRHPDDRPDGHSNHVRLPVLTLPTFDGDPLQFKSFWDVFIDCVDKRTNISNTSKMNYLIGQLRGEAAQLLTGFACTNDSYSEACNLLESTYGKSHRIVQAHLHSIFDLQPPTANATDLSRYRAQYESHLRSLKALDINVEESGHVYAALLVRKLPYTIRDNIYRTTRSNYLELKDLRIAISEEIEHLAIDKQDNVRQPRIRQQVGTASHFHISTSKLTCFLCNGDHMATRCPTYVTPEKRRDQARIKRLCFNCLSNSHNSYNCQSTECCKRCSQRHHTSLCVQRDTYSPRYQTERTSDRQSTRYVPPRLHQSQITQNRQPTTTNQQAPTSRDQPTPQNQPMPPNQPMTYAYGQPLAYNQPTVTQQNTQPQTVSYNQPTSLLTSTHIPNEFIPQQPPNYTGQSVPVNYTQANSTSINFTNISNDSTILPTAMIGINLHQTTYYLRTLFDQGAQKTFILEDTVRNLNISPHRSVHMTIDGFNSRAESRYYDVVQVCCVTFDGPIYIEAIVVPRLPEKITMNGRRDTLHNLQAKGIYIADPTDDDVITNIQLIIGADYYFDFMYAPYVDNISLIPSRVGYIMAGRLLSTSPVDNVTTNTVTALCIGVNDDEKCDVSKLWTLDTIGITPEGDASIEQNVTIQNFENNVQFDGQRYTAKLPWKDTHPPLPTNEILARKRLECTLKRLRNTQTLDHYNDIIKGHVTEGFVERVENDIPHVDAKLHYLSHHAVKKDSVTTPIRVVFDCSAKLGPSQASLNDCLLTGPSLVQELGLMLLLFRSHAYAAIADIKQAFLNVGLSEECRDSTRFFWPDDPHDPNSNIGTYRFTSVLFGSTASQFLLNATLRHHLNASHSPIAPKILERLYIDNLQTTEENEENLRDFYEESRQVMKDAGFTLREWHSNSPLVNDAIQRNGDGMVLKPQQTDVPILGMRWNSNTDTMGYTNKQFTCNADEALTKRQVVSQAAQTYDPLGWLTPVTIRCRMFIQELWKCSLDWDDKLSREQQDVWLKITTDVEQATEITQPRVLQIRDGETAIHCFSDSSMKAYGAVLYVVTGDKVEIVTSKSRVVPLRNITLPQLELTAANIAARLCKYVVDAFRDSFTPTSINMWSDSQITLQWIKSEKPLKSYVQKRVDEINSLLPSAKWRHVSTGDNPADLISRGMTAKAYLTSKLWWLGPEFLTKPISGNESGEPMTADDTCDDVTVTYTQTDAIRPTTVKPTDTIITEDVIDVEKHSNYNRLVRITAYVRKFCDNLKRKISPRMSDRLHADTSDNLADSDNYGSECDRLSVDDVIHAERHLIQCAQRRVYVEEYQFMLGSAQRVPNLVKQLQLFLDDSGIIRCHTRLQNADLSWDARNPILLPSRDHLTQLIIREAHERTFHGGVASTLSYLREHWWIPSGRQRVRSECRRCVTCRRLQTRPYAVPESPPLPTVRVNESLPFDVTGVDYTGALYVISNDVTIKVYIALFTCTLTRAVHLEIVEDNTCDAFIRAFRRFVGRRGCPSVLLSDNSTTFPHDECPT